MWLHAGPIFEVTLPGQGFTQFLGNSIDVFVFPPSYSAQTEFKRFVRGSCCVSVLLFGLDACGRLTCNRCANVIGSLAVSVRQIVDHANQYLGDVVVRTTPIPPVRRAVTAGKVQEALQNCILTQAMRSEVTVKFAMNP